MSSEKRKGGTPAYVSLRRREERTENQTKEASGTEGEGGKRGIGK